MIDLRVVVTRKTTTPIRRKPSRNKAGVALFILEGQCQKHRPFLLRGWNLRSACGNDG